MSVISSSINNRINASAHQFTPMEPAPSNEKQEAKDVPVASSKEVITYKNTEKGDLIVEEHQEKKKESTILGSSFMLTNLCLGTTIFTFAIRAKQFGLIWFLWQL